MATSLEMKNKMVNKQIADYYWDHKNKRHVLFFTDGTQEVLFGRYSFENDEIYKEYKYVKAENGYKIQR